MDPRAGRLADRGLDDVDERGHVVIGDRLAITDRLRRTPSSMTGALARQAAASSAGTMPSSACASVASSSISR